MIENLINEIEQAMLNTLNNEQLSQLRKVLEYTFRNVSVTESSNTTTAESNSELVKSFLVKTEDIHPPKTGISVHFCVLSLMAMQK